MILRFLEEQVLWWEINDFKQHSQQVKFEKLILLLKECNLKNIQLKVQMVKFNPKLKLKQNKTIMINKVKI